MALDLEAIYRDLHAHPELSFAEERTAGVVADALSGLADEVHTGVGGTGVVGVLVNGDGPVVMLRADMDALPVQEETGLPYASTPRGTDPEGRDVPVMHACGHDVHVTCLLGAAERLASDRGSWRGTVVLVFQPAEEVAGGAQGMIDGGLFDMVPAPSIVLGQHVAPLPAGWVAVHPGVALAGADSVDITLHGSGGHGSRPESTIDPVVMAAATVLRLQTIVSREVAATEPVVVSVGQVHAGTKNNIIPSEARLGLSIRTFSASTRSEVLAAIERLARAEAAASGATQEPDIVRSDSYPPTVNDPDATARTAAAFRETLGADRVVDPNVVSGSEDVGLLATASGAPLVYWLLGGFDPALFADFFRTGQAPDLPSNHSPRFAPLPSPTLDVGVSALVAAARCWLG